MKKAVISILLVLVMLITAACGPSGNNSAVPTNNSASNDVTPPSNNVDPTNSVDPPDNTVEPSNTVDPPSVEPVETDAERYERIYSKGIHNADDLAFFLDGEWSLLPEGTQPGYVQEYGYLSFDSSAKTATFDLKIGGPSKVNMTFRSDKLYSDMNNSSEDVLFLEVKSADGTLAKKDSSLIGSKGQYQILFTQRNNDDIMLLRHIANGGSPITSSVFLDEHVTPDGCFVFYRLGGTKSKVSLNDAYFKDNSYFNVTFIAIKWMENEGSCYLTPVNFEYYKDTFWDEPEEIIRIGYNIKNAMYAIKYDKKDVGDHVDNVIYEPRLVEVTVDSNSIITEMQIHPYHGFGVYDPEFEKKDEQGPNGGGSDNRDSATYGTCDKIYIGEWVDPTNASNTGVISADSPQVGGYKLDFMFGDVKVNGYANITDGNSLYINQAYVNGNIRLEGVIEKTSDGIRLRVTKCDWIKAPAGTIFKYAPKGSVEPGPNGGEGSEYRDPEKFSFCDWFFPKTWYLRSDHKKTLVVTKDSLQVGGYKIVFTTPDGAKAECYGYPEDGYLIINQGIINGKYRFTGHLSQMDEVFMKLMITDSESKSLKVGTMLDYDPKK